MPHRDGIGTRPLEHVTSLDQQSLHAATPAASRIEVQLAKHNAFEPQGLVNRLVQVPVEHEVKGRCRGRPRHLRQQPDELVLRAVQVPQLVGHQVPQTS